MSSTGIINGTYDDLEADNIDVNDSLFINNINIIELINDVSNNSTNKINDVSGNINNKINDISGNINNKINDISGNINYKINDLSGNINYRINDLSGNTNNKINDVSGNLSDLITTVTDLSDNVAAIKSKNDIQELSIFEHSAQIQLNTDAIAAGAGLLTTNIAATGANTATIAGIIGTIGVPSTTITPGTGIYGSIDSKTSRSLFGSGNVGIINSGTYEYINLVYNNDHFEDINHALNLKESYKSLPTSLNNLSNIVNTKQDNLFFTSPILKDTSNNITIDLSAYPLKINVDTSLNNIINTKQNNLSFSNPLIKDASNNITIDLSAYPLKINVDASLNNIISTKQNNLSFINPLIKDASNNITLNLSGYPIGNIRGTKAIINEGYLDPSGNSLTFYHNNPGTYFTDNGFNSYFNLCSATVTNNSGLAIVPFITNYNRMFKNGINNAIKISSTGSSNSNVNSSTYILLDSGGDPTPGTNVGTIKFNLATQAEGALDRFVIKPSTSIFYNNVGIGKSPLFALDVSGNINATGLIYTPGVMPLFDGNPRDMNIRTRLTGNLNLVSETGNIYLNTSNVDRFRIDSSGNVYSYGNLDVSANITSNGNLDISGNIKTLGKITTNSLDVSANIISYGNLDISGNIKAVGKITTNSLDVSANIISYGNLDISGNIKALGKITTNSLDVSGNINIQNSSNPNNTTISINSETNSYNSKLILGSGYIGSNPVNSFTDISTCQIITKRNNLYIDAAVGKTININSEANGNINSYGAWSHNGNLVTNDVSVNTIYVINDIVSKKIYTSNATSKSLIKFQTKLGAGGLYYYNIDLSKYYKTGQTINSNEYKIFNLTSWSEDGFSIINKCTVYISSQSPGIKYIMFYDNWGAYLSNGNQSGWQRDNIIGYMTFVSATQKNIITILENLL